MEARAGLVKWLHTRARRESGRLTAGRWRAVRRWCRLTRVPSGMVLVAALVLAVAAVGLVPPLMSPDLNDAQVQFELRDRARFTVAAFIGALGVLVSAYLNWRRVSALEEQVTAAQLGQITERFTRAIDQLGTL